jgi:hypothetical protein
MWGLIAPEEVRPIDTELLSENSGNLNSPVSRLIVLIVAESEPSNFPVNGWVYDSPLACVTVMSNAPLLL